MEMDAQGLGAPSFLRGAGRRCSGSHFAGLYVQRIQLVVRRYKVVWEKPLTASSGYWARMYTERFEMKAPTAEGRLNRVRTEVYVRKNIDIIVCVKNVVELNDH